MSNKSSWDTIFFFALGTILGVVSSSSADLSQRHPSSSGKNISHEQILLDKGCLSLAAGTKAGRLCGMPEPIGEKQESLLGTKKATPLTSSPYAPGFQAFPKTATSLIREPGLLNCCC